MRAFVLFAVLLFLYPQSVLSDERILEYRSDIHVHANSEITVTESIRVRAEGKSIRRGIFRDFPTRYRDRLGNFVNVGFKPLEVNRNGGPESWHTKDMPNGVRVYAGHPDLTLSPGTYDYEIKYTTTRQLGFFDDHDELYFNAVGNGWEFPVDRAIVTVTLPFDVPAGQVALDVYTGSSGSIEAAADAQVIGPRKARFETTHPLRPRQGLTIAVAWPKGLIAEPGRQQKLRWFLTDNGAAIVLPLGLLLPLAWYLWSWSRVGRNPDRGVVIPRFEPPAGISPAGSQYVRNMSFNRNSFTAAIISLAVKGQLAIEEDDDKEFTLERVSSLPAAGLTRGEEAVLTSLFPGGSSRIRMENDNHSEFQAARKALQAELKKEHLGRLFNLNSVYLAPPFLMSVAAALIAAQFDGGPPVWITFAILTVALHLSFLFLMRAPTVAGQVVRDEIDGFRMYLETAEQDRLNRMRSPELTPEVFEAFLPYAYALGVENQWCRRFSREMPREVREGRGYNPGWYHGRFSGMNALHHLGDGFGNTFSTAISSAASPPGSSSGSGGGGSSGGGGGGGGGGGW